MAILNDLKRESKDKRLIEEFDGVFLVPGIGLVFVWDDSVRRISFSL